MKDKHIIEAIPIDRIKALIEVNIEFIIRSPEYYKETLEGKGYLSGRRDALKDLMEYMGISDQKPLF